MSIKAFVAPARKIKKWYKKWSKMWYYLALPWQT